MLMKLGVVTEDECFRFFFALWPVVLHTKSHPMTSHTQNWQIPSAIQCVLLSISFLLEEIWGKLGVLPLLTILVSFYLWFSSSFFFFFFSCHTFSSTHLNYKFNQFSSFLTAFSSPWAYFLLCPNIFLFLSNTKCKTAPLVFRGMLSPSKEESLLKLISELWKFQGTL